MRAFIAFLNSFSNNRLSKLTFDKIVLKYSSMSIIVKEQTPVVNLALCSIVLFNKNYQRVTSNVI